MRTYENMSRAGVYDCLVDCPPGTEEFGEVMRPASGTLDAEPYATVRLDVLEAVRPATTLIDTPGVLPFRQDYWRKRREDLEWSIACRLTKQNPDRSTEDIMAAARKFTQAVGTFVGAYRRGFLYGNAGIELRTDGFSFPVVLKTPNEVDS